MDPQHRLLLQSAHTTLMDAHVSTTSISCYIGIGTADYQVLLQSMAAEPNAYSFTANSSSVAAGRLSYVLGLKGPSASIDTACSASLVALHMGAQDVRYVVAVCSGHV